MLQSKARAFAQCRMSSVWPRAATTEPSFTGGPQEGPSVPFQRSARLSRERLSSPCKLDAFLVRGRSPLHRVFGGLPFCRIAVPEATG